VASQANQFGGYSQGPVGGITKYNAAVNSLDRSAPCNDLTDVVNAMNYVLQNGSQLASSYIYWKAINQGKYLSIRRYQRWQHGVWHEQYGAPAFAEKVIDNAPFSNHRCDFVGCIVEPEWTVYEDAAPTPLCRGN
jgi:hypothetical protein